MSCKLLFDEHVYYRIYFVQFLGASANLLCYVRPSVRPSEVSNRLKNSVVKIYRCFCTNCGLSQAFSDECVISHDAF
jgi:hypothetical protein